LQILFDMFYFSISSTARCFSGMLSDRIQRGLFRIANSFGYVFFCNPARGPLFYQNAMFFFQNPARRVIFLQ
jgi:hypothetical protein